VYTKYEKTLIGQNFENLNNIFAKITEFEAGRSIDDLLQVQVRHSGFKRLN